jgi:hypothetical protein
MFVISDRQNVLKKKSLKVAECIRGYQMAIANNMAAKPVHVDGPLRTKGKPLGGMNKEK